MKAELINAKQRQAIRLYDAVSGRGKGSRLSSYPFISGDTYRCSSDAVFDGSRQSLLTLETTRDDMSRNPVLFCDLKFLNELESLCEEFDLSSVNLVVHNGDTVPEKIIRDLSQVFLKIHCVNWLGDRNFADPIPIGLENASINVNGRVKDFVQFYPHNLRPNIFKERSSSCVLTFNVENNLSERLGIHDLFRTVPSVQIFEKRIPRATYLKALIENYFVVSPPGNGPDCHRTWEAMYAGAIPIVLSRAWPFDHMKLPALIVASWNDAIEQLMDNNVQDLHHEIWENSNWDQIYFTHNWLALDHAKDSMPKPDGGCEEIN